MERIPALKQRQPENETTCLTVSHTSTETKNSLYC